MSAMTIEQTEQEMEVLKAQLDSTINEFHRRTGLPINIYINQIDATDFQSAKPKYFYEAHITMEIQAARA
jgi:hypothetical protein